MTWRRSQQKLYFKYLVEKIRPKLQSQDSLFVAKTISGPYGNVEEYNTVGGIISHLLFGKKDDANFISFLK